MKKLLSLTVVLVMIMAILPTAGIITVSAAETGAYALSIEGTETLYDQYADDYDDPNWITDEELFGVWDGSSWTTESLLNYDKYFKELENVEKAAKAGDYATAKEYVTEYYRNKFLNQPRAITKTGTTTALINAHMLAYNMFGASNFTNYDIVTLTTDEKLIQADITGAAQSAANSTAGKEYSFQIAATHDDGHIGYIYSRESGKAPYVEANVDGNMMTFPVIADTYIRGGQYETINYGTTETNPENKLYMAEHVDYSNSGIGYPATQFEWKDVNVEGVMRTRLTVDFSALTAGSVVNSAKLCFTGASNNPNGKTVVIQYKSDMGGSETDKNWTWKSAPRFMVSYWGLPGTAAFAGDNSTQFDRYIAKNWDAVGGLTGVYRYTEDETYAYHAFRYMNALINEHGYNPLVYARGSANNWENNLACATRSESLPVQLVQLATSEHFTAENFVPILKYAYSSGEALVHCWNGMSETTNWGTYETAGLANLAINFKEFRIVDEEITDGGYGNGKQGGWMDLCSHRYATISGEIFRADGSFTETMGYGKETFKNILKFTQYAEAAGEAVVLGETLENKLNMLATYLMNVSSPGFTTKQYGDSYSIGADFAVVALWATQYTSNPDPFLLWAGTYGKEGVAPEYTSVFYPDNRKFVSRTGWGTNDLMFDFSADSIVQTSHNHADDLNITLFGYGEPLLVDSMQYNYGTNDPKRLRVYETAMHNTLAIKIYNPETGQDENLSMIQNISGVYNGAYPVYSEFLPTNEWGNSWFNRSRDAQPGTVHRTEMNDGYDYAEMSHANFENWTHAGYPFAKANVNMKRSILTNRNAKYLIVTDYVKALDDEEYRVTQNWHFLPETGFNTEAAKEEFEATGIAKTNAPGKANLQIIPVKAQSDLKYVYENEGYYCKQTGVIQWNPYPVYEKGGAGDKVFNTILLPTSGGQNITSQAINLQMDVPETVASASYITMTDNDLDQTREVYYYFLHDERYKEQRDFGKYTTDSKMTLVEYNAGLPSQLIIQDGTIITDTASQKILLNSGEVLEELSVTFDSGNVYLDTSKEIDLDSLTILAEAPVSKVFLNDESVKFTQADNYIYFGDQPILSAPSENDPEEDNVTKVPSHGSNSSGGGSDKEEPKPEEPKPEDPKPETPQSDAFKAELQGHWGEAEIAGLIDGGIVKGSGGKLNLKNTVTRAELLALITRALGIEEKAYSGEFADVEADDWYAGVIAAAKAAGLVDGDGEMVMPNAPVTREQMAKFLVAAYAVKNPDAEGGEVLSFTDSDEISAWAVEFVNKATSLGILNGMGDGTFAPKNAVLREQAFTAIARLMK